MKLFAILLAGILFVGCERELPTSQVFPVIRTLSVANVDETGATFRAEILREGQTEISSYGFVWGNAEPTIASSNKIVLGSQINEKTFEKRIDYSLAGGLTYHVKAFVTYGNKTVYANTTVFESQGSSHSPWALEKKSPTLAGWFSSYGSSTASQGYVLYQSSEFYIYKPEDNSFLSAKPFPVSGNSGTNFTAILMGNTQFFFSSINRNLYRFENGVWSVESQFPFSYGNFGGYYHGHTANGKIYILSSAYSQMYDPNTKTWLTLPRLPIQTGYSIGGVSLGDKAYVITTDKNIWEYDVAGNSWNIKAVYPGLINERIVSFPNQNKIYFGLSYGRISSDNIWMQREFWSYEPAENKWVLQDIFPAVLESADLFFFNLKGELYIGHGFQNYDIWKFDPS